MKTVDRAKKVIGKDSNYTVSLEVFEADLKAFCASYFDSPDLRTELIPHKDGLILHVTIYARSGINYVTLRHI